MEGKMPLTATGESAHYEPSSDNVYFFMLHGFRRIRCAVTYQALEKFEPKLNRGERTELACFSTNRSDIEKTASIKFDKQYIKGRRHSHGES
jgi:hypothetical protein